MGSTHYVATIKIVRVDHVDTKPPTGIGGFASVVANETKRVVTPLVSFTVPNDDLTELVTTIGHHLVHVNDITAVDPEKSNIR